MILTDLSFDNLTLEKICPEERDRASRPQQLLCRN